MTLLKKRDEQITGLKKQTKELSFQLKGYEQLVQSKTTLIE